MGYMLALIALGTGAALTWYAAATALDPYWPPTTRMAAICAAGFGAATVVAAVWSVFL